MAQHVVKKLKVSEECCESTGETFVLGDMSSDFAESRLLTLPDHVLEKIFAYLSPISIVNIRKLGFFQLADCTFRLKEADFSKCTRIRPEVLKAFFCMHSVQRITKINLNGVFFVSSNILITCIMKCKNLSVLSVEECGLSLPQIVDICKSCPNLEELCFSISKYVPPTKSDKCPSVRKLYLSCVLRVHGYCPLEDYLETFPNVTIVYLNYSHNYFLGLPYNNDCVQLMEVEHRNKTLIVNLVSVIEKSCSNFKSAKYILLPLWTTANYKVPAYSYKDSLSQQFPTLAKDSHGLPSSLVPSLGLNMFDKASQDLIESTKKIAGKKLEHLAINGFEFGSYQHNQLSVDSIPEILLNSSNISVLNISIIHFENTLPLSCLHSMKSLEILSLPGCAISSIILGHQKKEIENLVINCKNVKKFSMTDCKVCLLGPNDDDLTPIHKWKGLISLSVIRMFRLQLYSFLDHVANFCPDFQSLEIIQNGVKSECHYIPSVMHILKSSPKLKLLRINDRGFFPMDTIFWKAIASAQNLEGLCLATSYKMCASAATITDAIGQLPYLHLVHLESACKTCRGLEPRIQSLMGQRGIQSSSINVHCCISYGRRMLLCTESHFVI